MAHPTAGTVRNIDSTVRINDANANVDVAPPLLGAHTHEVLRDVLGMAQAQVADLEARNVIRCSRA